MSGEVAKCYDSNAKLYAELFLDELEKDEDTRRHLVAFAEAAICHSGAVADVGCGPGHVTEYLSQLGLAVSGYDISSGQIAQARNAFPDLHFEVGDLAALGIANSALGGIVSRYSIIHMPPSDLKSAFAEWHRALEPKAPAYVSFFGSLSEEAHGTPFDHKVVTAYELFPKTVASQMEEVGFSIVEIEALSPPEGGRPFSRASVLATNSA